MNLQRRKIFAVMAALACTLSGCRHGGDADCAQVRLIDALPDPAGISASVNNHLVWKHAAYADNSGYQKVNAGHYQMHLQAGDRTASQEVMLDKGRHYTVVALPASSSLRVRVFNDDSNAPVPAGQACLTVIDAASGTAALDVLADNIVAVPDLTSGRRAEPLLLKAGDYEFKLNVADSVRSITAPLTLHLDGGKVYTLVVMGGGAAGYTIKTFDEGG